MLSDYRPSLRKLEKIAAEDEVKWVCSGHTDAFRDASIISEMAELVEGIAGGKHAPPPRKMKHPSGGMIDVYQGTRFPSGSPRVHGGSSRKNRDESP